MSKKKMMKIRMILAHGAYFIEKIFYKIKFTEIYRIKFTEKVDEWEKYAIISSSANKNTRTVV